MYPRALRHTTKEGGFTLIELMLVIAIIGILAGIGVPYYNDYVIKSKRSDAKNILLEVAAKQEQYFMDNRQYASTLAALGVTSTSTAYNVSIVDATDDCPLRNCFEAQAVPVGRQLRDLCGTYEINSLGEKSPADTASLKGCW